MWLCEKVCKHSPVYVSHTLLRSAGTGKRTQKSRHCPSRHAPHRRRSIARSTPHPCVLSVSPCECARHAPRNVPTQSPTQSRSLCKQSHALRTSGCCPCTTTGAGTTRRPAFPNAPSGQPDVYVLGMSKAPTGVRTQHGRRALSMGDALAPVIVV